MSGALAVPERVVLMGSAHNGTPGWWQRLLPPRLTTRLIYTMAIAAAGVFVVVATLVSFLVAHYTRVLVTTDARNQLAQLDMSIAAQGHRLDTFAATLAEPSDLHDRTDTVAAVWALEDGTILDSSGSPADVQALLATARETVGDGVIVLPSGPAIAAMRSLAAAPGRPAAGIVAVAGPLDHADDPLLAQGVRIVAVSDTLPTPTSGHRTMQAPAGFEWFTGHIQGLDLVTQAAYKTIDDHYLLFEIARPDPYIGDGRLWAVIVLPVGLGVAIIGIGVLVGAMVSRSVGRPLGQFVAYMQDQGYLALQGLRADEDLVIDPNLPSDFQELGQVILDLMTQLRVNQAELIEAGEQALTAEQAFRTVVEESPEVKVLVREGVVEIANPAAAHFFGLHLGDLVRADPEGLFAGVGLYDEGGRRLDLPAIARAAVAGPVVVLCTTPNQPDRWVEMSVAAMDPGLRDYVISARNVTEERRLEALREEILSLVSHDLRSPLTVVRGYIDMLERPLDDDRRTAAAAAARKASERMEGLLDDLLHATRAERIFAPTTMRIVDLSSLASTTAASLQIGAEQNIRVISDVEVVVIGDEVRLEQALSNLVGNAIKHGPAEGEIRVTVSAVGDRAFVAVEDDGPGIPEGLREELFDRGARGNASASKPGLGLGLYIVRVVAEAHGGSAYIADGGQGTRFVVELPLEGIRVD